MTLFPDMRQRAKRAAFTVPAFHSLWRTWRSDQVERAYRARREKYQQAAVERGLVYREADMPAMIQRHLAARGYTPPKRRTGEIHTFAFVPDVQWHDFLIPDLAELGTVTRFDYVKLGYGLAEFHTLTAEAMERRRVMNERFFATLRETHRRQPVDWVFAYASGIEVQASTIRRITEELGIPVVNMCLDDKQSWEGPFLGDHRGGQIDIAGVFDLTMTSARVACEWYLVEGGRPLYLPEGVDSSFFRPELPVQDIDVGFVGVAYGFRPFTIRNLRRHGVNVQTFGSGWENSTWVDDPVTVFQRSRINLGMGGIGYSEILTNVKGRDFEVPAVGGGAYLTSYNCDLAQHFEVGREILCYRGDDEMLELIRYHLRHPDETKEIARRGRARCEREHRWLHRFTRICTVLGILE